MKQFVAGANEAEMRLSKFVENVTQDMPKSLLYKSFRNKRIKVNGKRAEADYRINKGDVIELYINDEFFADKAATPPKKQKRKNSATPQILFEDENITALYKPAHLLCHSDRTKDDNLTDMLRDYLSEKCEYNQDTEHTFAPSICNRLDRGTSGIVIAAKNYTALKCMNELIRENLVTKKYMCITFGIPREGVHTAYLKHSEKTNKVHIISTQKEGYKNIITGVKILQKNGAFCLCEIDLITGRTHQIRAHLTYLGAPILGDIKYGNRKINEKLGAKTQELCAYKFGFCSDIPKENVLHYLKEHVIEVEKPEVLLAFEKISRGKPV